MQSFLDLWSIGLESLRVRWMELTSQLSTSELGCPCPCWLVRLVTEIVSNTGTLLENKTIWLNYKAWLLCHSKSWNLSFVIFISEIVRGWTIVNHLEDLFLIIGGNSTTFPILNRPDAEGMSWSLCGVVRLVPSQVFLLTFLSYFLNWWPIC